jgi:hypothetical protein
MKCFICRNEKEFSKAISFLKGNGYTLINFEYDYFLRCNIAAGVVYDTKAKKATTDCVHFYPYLSRLIKKYEISRIQVVNKIEI